MPPEGLCCWQIVVDDEVIGSGTIYGASMRPSQYRYGIRHLPPMAETPSPLETIMGFPPQCVAPSRGLGQS